MAVALYPGSAAVRSARRVAAGLSAVEPGRLVERTWLDGTGCDFRQGRDQRRAAADRTAALHAQRQRCGRRHCPAHRRPRKRWRHSSWRRRGPGARSRDCESRRDVERHRRAGGVGRPGTVHAWRAQLARQRAGIRSTRQAGSRTARPHRRHRARYRWHAATGRAQTVRCFPGSRSTRCTRSDRPAAATCVGPDRGRERLRSRRLRRSVARQARLRSREPGAAAGSRARSQADTHAVARRVTRPTAFG